MKWMPYGRDAILVQFADSVGEEAFSRSRAIVAELERSPPAGLVEFVPAFTTVLIEFNSEAAAELPKLATDLIHQLESAPQLATPPPKPKEIPVTYDGPDLERVARWNGLTAQEVREIHAKCVYYVHMLGFSPGFPYLAKLDSRLHTPRLATPRTRVPAGSVAIGGEHTGIYTVDSPGGWNIIGHTDCRIFDPGRGQTSAEIFLLRPGDRVQFVPAPT